MKNQRLHKFIIHKYDKIENFLKIFKGNRTYYRIIKGETKPQEKTVQKFVNILGVDKKTFSKMLSLEIEERQNKTKV